MIEPLFNTELSHLVRKMVELPRFLTYDIDGRGIEVKPGRFSPVFVNMKSLWSYQEVIIKIVSELERFCIRCDHIVGIESGGSPFASLLSHRLRVPLILVRKDKKDFFGFLAGYIKGQSSCFAIVDDVIATAASMKSAIEQIKNDEREIRLITVLSYGLDVEICKYYGVKMFSLFQIEDILDVLSPELRETLLPFIQQFKKKIKESFAV
jgi:orotate phosphoribosyltransferase